MHLIKCNKTNKEYCYGAKAVYYEYNSTQQLRRSDRPLLLAVRRRVLYPIGRNYPDCGNTHQSRDEDRLIVCRTQYIVLS